MTLKYAGKGIRGIFKFYTNTQAQETLSFLVYFRNQTQSILSSHPVKEIKTFISGMGLLLIHRVALQGKQLSLLSSSPHHQGGLSTVP